MFPSYQRTLRQRHPCIPASFLAGRHRRTSLPFRLTYQVSSRATSIGGIVLTETLPKSRALAPESVRFCDRGLHSVTVVRLRNLLLTEPCSGFPVPILSKSVKKTAKKIALQVCLISPHPLVLSEFERVLEGPDFKTISEHLESTLGPDLRHLPIPKATVYVVDAHVAKSAAGALLSNILEQHSEARIIVVAEKFDAAESYSLLQMGAKGLLSYSEAREQLPRSEEHT